MRKRRLLYFVSEDKYFLTHKLPHALIALKNGFRVLVVCKCTTEKKKIFSYGFEVQDLNLDRKNINPFKELRNLFKFYKIISNFKPDIIVNVALKPIIFSSICSSLFKKNIKLKIHAVVGLGYLFINKGLKVLILKSLLEKLLFLFINDSKSITIFQNRDDLNYFLEKKIILNSKQTRLIKSSGVDINYFKPSKTIKKKYDLIMHSRMLVDKGVLDLISAIKELKKRKIYLKILLLGNPDSKNLASISKKQLIAWSKEKIIEWQPAKKNIKKYIQSSKIAILPSYREGFPKSLLEAASCGLPLISNNVTGCKEICIDGYNGLLVEVNDYLSLSKKIKYLMSNHKLMTKMGRNSRELVVKNFSEKIISDKFLELYQIVKV